MIETEVLVVGSSLSAMMTTLNLRHRNPDLAVTVLGPLPTEEKRPVVGESLVEPGILFFREVGMGPHLDQLQVLKNGLIFYHKFDLSDPADRAYSVHSPEVLYHNARQLRRQEFDLACRERAIELGAKMLHGTANQITIGTGGQRHRVQATVDGQPTEIVARWIVDATGRKRLIGKQVTEYERPAKQRSTFWFRLARFRPFFDSLEVHWRRPLRFDPWLTTHHFLGKGYWIRCIPLELGENNLCSVGFTYRPDVFGDKLIRSVDDFLAQVDRDHPVVSEMVRSGEVVDTQRYIDYFYKSERLYSEDGWFLVGDAARTVDPLYSNGISMTTVQVGQIAEIIERQRAGTLRPGEVATLEAAGKWIMERAQREVTEQYPIMHDPFQACMRRYLNVTGWFNAFLPFWWNGFFTTPEGASVLLRLFHDRDEDAESLWQLAAEASAAIGPQYRQEDFDRGPDLDRLLQLRFDCSKQELVQVVSGMFRRRRYFRWRLLAMNGYKNLLREVPHFASEYLRPVLLQLLARLRREAFEAVRPPLRDQYARWTGPERYVPEPDSSRTGAEWVTD